MKKPTGRSKSPSKSGTAANPVPELKNARAATGELVRGDLVIVPRGAAIDTISTSSRTWNLSGTRCAQQPELAFVVQMVPTEKPLVVLREVLIITRTGFGYIAAGALLRP